MAKKRIIKNCKLFVLLFFIVVILDLKGLYLLVVSRDDENFNFKLAKKALKWSSVLYVMLYGYVENAP